MHVPLLSANLLICEKTLDEKDDVISVIRMVDVFYLRIDEAEPPEKQGVAFRIFIQIKFDPQDTTEHAVELKIMRPDGEVQQIGASAKITAGSTIPGLPGGANLIAPIVVLARQWGLHFVILEVDGSELRRIPFTLLQRQEELTDDSK
jgi:hypothetical protein